MLTLENEFLVVTFNTKGAELRSVYHKKFQTNYLWNGDESYWNRCSPVLFPIVGKVKNNTYSYQDQEYKLTQHGFARDTTFIVEQQAEHTITFSMASTDQTKLVYPFDFKLSITYTILESSLVVAYRVINKGTSTQLFSIGAHPGFLCPLEEGLSFEDYFLAFEKEETAPRLLVGEGGISRNTEPVFASHSNTIPLHLNLFGKKDAIILKDLRSRYMELKSNRGERGLRFTFEGFPYMGIWTKPGPFLCIEPWFGIADFEDADGKLEHKEGICKLPIGQDFNASYTMVFF